VRTVSTSSPAIAAVPGVRYRLSRLVSLHRSERGGGWWVRGVDVMHALHDVHGGTIQYALLGLLGQRLGLAL
jgi:hypothetical protein